MIILDTNVISELMRTAPEPIVLDWHRALPMTLLATTTINVAEIRYGLARLPFGRRRATLESRFGAFLSRGFEGRIFDFDEPAATAYGEMAAARERSGRRLDGFDGLIAAIARSRGLALATRNIDDFAGCEIDVLSPWLDNRP
jgi:predicted nucleic acid-binding protein